MGQPQCEKAQCSGYDKEGLRLETFMQQHDRAMNRLRDGKPMPKHLMLLFDGAPDPKDCHDAAQVLPDGCSSKTELEIKDCTCKR